MPNYTCQINYNEWFSTDGNYTFLLTPTASYSFVFELWFPNFDTATKTYSNSYVDVFRLQRGQLFSIQADNYGEEGPPMVTYDEIEFQKNCRIPYDKKYAKFEGGPYSDQLQFAYWHGYVTYSGSGLILSTEISSKFYEALKKNNAVVTLNGTALTGRGEFSIEGTSFSETKTVSFEINWALYDEINWNQLNRLFGNPYSRIDITVSIPYFTAQKSGEKYILKVPYKLEMKETFDYSCVVGDFRSADEIAQIVTEKAYQLALSDLSVEIVASGKYSDLEDGAVPPSSGSYIVPGAPVLQVTNEDAPGTEALDRFAELTFLNLAPKEIVELSLRETEDELPELGEIIEVDGTNYLVESLSYADGWFKVTAWRPLTEQVTASSIENKMADAIKSQNMKRGALVSTEANYVRVQTPFGEINVPKSKAIIQDSTVFWR